MMQLKNRVFSSLPQRLQFVDVFTAYESASSRRIALYSSFDYFRRYPSGISFFTDQLALPTPRGTQVCKAEGF